MRIHDVEPANPSGGAAASRRAAYGFDCRGSRLTAKTAAPCGRSRLASITERLQDAWYAVEDAALAAGRAHRRRRHGSCGSSGSTSRPTPGGASAWRWARWWRSLLLWLAGGPGASLPGAGWGHVPTGRRRDPPGSRGRPRLRAPERRSRHRAVPGGGQGRLARCRRSPSRRSAALLARLPGPQGAARLRARHRALVRWRGGAGDHPNGRRPARRSSCSRRVTRTARRSSPIRSRPGRRASTTYRDVQVQVDHRGLATALVGGFLAIGTERGVRDVIDADSGAKGTGSLAGRSATRARRGPPFPTSASPTPISSKEGHRAAGRQLGRAAGHARLGDQPGRQPGSGGGAGGERRRARGGGSLGARSRPSQGPPRFLLGLPHLRAHARRLVARATRSATWASAIPARR